MQITSAEFIKSASKLSECPPAEYPEFALVGRSNVGKSSLINMLTQRKQLAKSSVTPGKTQLLNYFLINKNWYLVDLPGYGYAKYSKQQRIEWMDTMQEYLTERSSLKMIFVLVDWSIPPQAIDMDFMEVLMEEWIPFEIIMTKTDKANQKDLHKHKTALEQELKKNEVIKEKIFQTSSNKWRWAKELLSYIETMFDA